MVDNSKTQAHRRYVIYPGRFQPMTEGHVAFIRKIFDEGKNVCVAMMTDWGKEIRDDRNPHIAYERFQMFKKEFPQEIKDERLIVMSIPYIEALAYGRKVGYDIREVRLDAKTEAISATKIRSKNKTKADWYSQVKPRRLKRTGAVSGNIF